MTIRAWLRASGVAVALWAGCRPLPGDSAGQPPPAVPGRADEAARMVDDQLRVHGLQGLRVVDASIMPRMISANLNASTLMIADKASDMIRGKTAPEAVKFPVQAQGVM